MQGWLKGQIHILQIEITIPRKRMSMGITEHSDPAGAGPEWKKNCQ